MVNENLIQLMLMAMSVGFHNAKNMPIDATFNPDDYKPIAISMIQTFGSTLTPGGKPVMPTTETTKETSQYHVPVVEKKEPEVQPAKQSAPEPVHTSRSETVNRLILDEETESMKEELKSALNWVKEFKQRNETEPVANTPVSTQPQANLFPEPDVIPQPVTPTPSKPLPYNTEADLEVLEDDDPPVEFAFPDINLSRKSTNPEPAKDPVRQTSPIVEKTTPDYYDRPVQPAYKNTPPVQRMTKEEEYAALQAAKGLRPYGPINDHAPAEHEPEEVFDLDGLTNNDQEEILETTDFGLDPHSYTASLANVLLESDEELIKLSKKYDIFFTDTVFIASKQKSKFIAFVIRLTDRIENTYFYKLIVYRIANDTLDNVTDKLTAAHALPNIDNLEETACRLSATEQVIYSQELDERVQEYVIGAWTENGRKKYMELLRNLRDSADNTELKNLYTYFIKNF